MKAGFARSSWTDTTARRPEPMDDFLEGLERALAKAGDALGCYSPADAKFLSFDTLARSWRTARIRPQESPPFGRIRTPRQAGQPARSPTSCLTRWEALKEEAQRGGKTWPWPETREALLDWFLEAARQENITMISEWQTFCRLGRQGRPAEIAGGRTSPAEEGGRDRALGESRPAPGKLEPHVSRSLEIGDLDGVPARPRGRSRPSPRPGRARRR